MCVCGCGKAISSDGYSKYIQTNIMRVIWSSIVVRCIVRLTGEIIGKKIYKKARGEDDLTQTQGRERKKNLSR